MCCVLCVVVVVVVEEGGEEENGRDLLNHPVADSRTENVYDPTVSWVNLSGHVRTLRELFLVSRTGDEPRAPAPRAHVETHVRVMPARGTF